MHTFSPVFSTHSLGPFLRPFPGTHYHTTPFIFLWQGHDFNEARQGRDEGNDTHAI